MIVHSGYDERYFAHFVHSSKNRVREQFRKSFTVKRIGGRDRDRTGDPLLAKQVLSQLSYTPTAGQTLILKHFRGFQNPFLCFGRTTPEFRTEFDKVWWGFLSLSDSANVVRQEAPDDHFLKGSSRETRATQGRSDAD